MLRWERKADGHFYAACITKDLLGDWIVIKSWGGPKRPIPHVASFVVESRSHAVDMLIAIARKRKSRGYDLRSIESLEDSQEAMNEALTRLNADS